jgi:taurine dioxygenase
MSVTETIRVTPAAGALGAVVQGLDLRTVDEAGAARLHELLMEHLVLVFPGQHNLTDDEQVRFTSHFGGPYIHPLARVQGVTELRAGRIVDDEDHPPFQDQYHTDVSWDPEPPTFGCLRMIQRPERGGDTIFSSMYAAYDALSEPMKQCLEGLVAWHGMGLQNAFRSKAGDAVVDAVEKIAPGSEMPVIATHPVTGRRFLNVNQGFTDHIVGMTRAESRAILDFCFAHATNPNFQMRWVWSNGDVVLWDERPTQHYAVADYYPQRREVARVNVR